LAAATLIPAWCWLLAGLLSTILLWRLRHRRLAYTLLVLWAVFAIGWVDNAASLSRAVFAAANSKTPREIGLIRIVTLNCDSNERCLADLQRVKPDVVLLQESPGQDGLAKLTSQLFGEAGTFISGGDTAILARGAIRQPYVDRSQHFVAGTVVLPDRGEVCCVSLRLAPPPSRLDFWNGGFWSDHRDLRNLHRRQLRQVMTHVREKPSLPPMIVGGDFNTVGLDRALDEMRPQLSDAFDWSGTGWGATGTNDWPLFRVDQVWTDSRLVPIRVFAVKTSSSDHRLVICDAVGSLSRNSARHSPPLHSEIERREHDDGD
jgi:endonuclease/exonuclease/phosphatase (EEP) superfamily protein YafD